MVSPNVGVQYLSLSYSVENNSETTFRVHTTIFNGREQAEKYFQLKSEQFNVNIVDVFKENFGYGYPDFEGIGNWHFYANFVYSANEAEFNYRSMCGFSDNTFFFYDDFFNKKKLALGQKTNLTKPTPPAEIISPDTGPKKPTNDPKFSTGDTGTNTSKNKLSKSNEKDSNPWLASKKKVDTTSSFNYNTISIIDPLIPNNCCNLSLPEQLGKMGDLYSSLMGGDRFVIVKLIGDQKRFLEHKFDSLTIFSNVKRFQVLKRSKHFIILLMALVMAALFMMSMSMYLVIKGIKDRMRSDVEELIASKKNRIIQA